MEYEKECDYIVRGSKICSRATWYEHGERNTRNIFSIWRQLAIKKKSCFRKLLIPDGEETTDAYVILIKGNL